MIMHFCSLLFSCMPTVYNNIVVCKDFICFLYLLPGLNQLVRELCIKHNKKFTLLEFKKIVQCIQAQQRHTNKGRFYMNSYDQAVNLVKTTKNATISFLQRNLNISYNKAAEYLNQMEKAGIVSPMNAEFKRTVL
ncbi:MAG: hypothetical protein IJQ55_02805 [Alphaproteobacteria bacterium]|nr:hypothetical protein [Alphaproteobacteria bacterium]